MTDPTGRVVPSSRQPVTPEDPASPTAAPSAETGGASASTAADQEISVGGTNALNPTTSAAASADATGDVRTANLEDARRESVRSTGRSADFGGGTTDTTDVLASTGGTTGSTYSDPGYGQSPYSTPSYDPAGTSAPSSADLMATGGSSVSGRAGEVPGTAVATADSGTGGATVLRASSGPSTKDKASVKAKELTGRAKVAAAKLTANDGAVGKASRGAQEHPLVLRAKGLVAKNRSGGGHARPVEAPRPAPPERPVPTSGPRSAEEIESDIAKTRAHLAWAVDEVNYQVKPATVLAKTKSKAQAQVKEPDGRVRTNRVGPAAGGLVGLLVLRIVRNRRRRRKVRKLLAERRLLAER